MYVVNFVVRCIEIWVCILWDVCVVGVVHILPDKPEANAYVARRDSVHIDKCSSSRRSCKWLVIHGPL